VNKEQHTLQLATDVRSVGRLLVAACVVPSSLIFVTLMKEAPGSSETSGLTRATRRNNPEDTILHMSIEVCVSRREYINGDMIGVGAAAVTCTTVQVSTLP
jgi:hypothetical protein